MKAWVGIIGLLLLSCFNAIASEPLEDIASHVSCGIQTSSEASFKFCIYQPRQSKNNDIVYFFHGLDGDERTWFNQYFGTRLIHNLWHIWGYHPRIITISFGPKWLLVNNERSHLLAYFKSFIMPLLEHKVGGINRGRRHLIGQSMGGFNAAEVSLKNPGLFKNVALLCPAITSIGPFASDYEVGKYIQRTGANPDFVKKLIDLGQEYFVDPEDWKNHDPLTLLSHYKAKKKSNFFISVGNEDDYGFQEGSLKFKLISKVRNFSSRIILVPGSHCNFSRWGAARFIWRK